MINEDDYNLKLTPDEQWLLIEALGTVMDVCDTYSGLHDPLIDKVRGELLTSWEDRFEQSDRT